MQSLCNLRHFRDKFLTEPLVWIPSADNICIAQQFYEIFTSWEKNDHHLTDAVLTYMKTLLCGVDCTIFSEKVYTLIIIIYICTIILLNKNYWMLVYHVKAESVIQFGSDITFKLFYLCVFVSYFLSIWSFVTFQHYMDDRCGITLECTNSGMLCYTLCYLSSASHCFCCVMCEVLN
jgi:hypothetical protein